MCGEDRAPRQRLAAGADAQPRPRCAVRAAGCRTSLCRGACASPPRPPRFVAPTPMVRHLAPLRAGAAALHSRGSADPAGGARWTTSTRTSRSQQVHQLLLHDTTTTRREDATGTAATGAPRSSHIRPSCKHTPSPCAPRAGAHHTNPGEPSLHAPLPSRSLLKPPSLLSTRAPPVVVRSTPPQMRCMLACDPEAPAAASASFGVPSSFSPRKDMSPLHPSSRALSSSPFET